MEAERLKYCRNITSCRSAVRKPVKSNNNCSFKFEVCSVCVRAPSARAGTRVRAGGGVEPALYSRHKPPGAQEKPQKNAHKSNSRCLKLRGAQRERRNFGEHGKSRHGASLRLSVCKRSASAAPGGFFFSFLFVVFRLGEPERTLRGTRRAGETKDPRGLMGN